MTKVLYNKECSVCNLDNTLDETIVLSPKLQSLRRKVKSLMIFADFANLWVDRTNKYVTTLLTQLTY